MKKIIAISAFLMLLGSVTSFAQLIDEAKLKDITSLLKKYELYNQFTTDGNNIDATYTQNFVNLFDAILYKELYNDFAATKEESFSFGSAQEYMQVVTKNYPYGVDVTLDMTQMKVVDVFHTKTKAGYIVMVPKKTAGLYRSKTFFRSNKPIYLFITEVAGEKQSDFKISGVLDPDSYQKYQGDNTITGLYVGLSGGYGATMVYNQEAFMNSDLYLIETQQNMNFGFEVSYMFTRGFGLGTGVGMNTYSTNYSIDYFNEQSPSLLKDMDGDQYLPSVHVSNLVETDVYESIEIPLLLKLRTGKGKTAFYMDLGIVYSLISGYYTQEGNSTRSGYYPEWELTLEDIPEYDFYTDKSLSATQTDLVVPSSGLSAYAAMGVSIPLSRNFYMKLGANVRYGITDMELGTNSHANGIADFVENPGETFLHCGGVELGISYNLSSVLKIK
ncbi:MAG: hypothetical protein WCX31_00540 [Salinivirgaceae bacterium]|jgi:hypothetical protein